MVRIRMKYNTPIFTPEDYSYIMQCCDIKPRYKILNELTDKYKTSTKRIYQIWRGVEANRVLWDQPIPYLYDDVSNFTSPTYQNTKCFKLKSCDLLWNNDTYVPATDTSSNNKSNSTINVTHIEFKPLDTKRNNSEERQGLEKAKLQVLDSSQIHHLVDGSVIDNSSVKLTQPNRVHHNYDRIQPQMRNLQNR
ncbi:3006_t:CDS:2, partial [Acaulospora morrowiae]